MNNIDFVNNVKSRLGQGYIYGAYFDRLITKEYLKVKINQYPKQYTDSYIQRSLRWIGHYAGDCVGLIKQAYWTNEKGEISYRYLGRADTSANGMLNLATVKGPINTMPEILGIGVHYNGHIGVYIGNGRVIESMGVDYGVVETLLNKRPWLNWLQVPYIDYSEKGEGILLKQGMKGEDVAIWQRLLIKWDNEALPEHKDDGSFGPETENWTNTFLQWSNLPQNGIVTMKVINEMIEALTARYKIKADYLDIIKQGIDIIRGL
jgi:hypothetical protein